MINCFRLSRFAIILTILFITIGAFILSCIQGSFVAHAQSFSPVEDIQDGDLIRVDGTYDVYIVKIINNKRFKRLILSPEIFNSYDSFNWENVKTISRDDMDFFVWSDLVVRQDGDRSLYRFFPQQRDDGVKSQVQLSSQDFIEASGDWDSLFEVNDFEFEYYRTIKSITTIEEFQSGPMFLMMDDEQSNVEQDNQDDAGINPPVTTPPTEVAPTTPESTQPTEGTLLVVKTSRIANNQTLIFEESKAVLGFKVQAQGSANSVQRVDVSFTAQGTSNNNLRPWGSFESISLVDLDQDNLALQTIRLSSTAHIDSNANSYTYRFQGFSLVIPRDGNKNLGVVATAKQDLESENYQSWIIEIPHNGVRGMDEIEEVRYAPQEAIQRSFNVHEPVGDVVIRSVNMAQGESSAKRMERDEYTDDVELLRFDVVNKGQIGVALDELKFNAEVSHSNARTLYQVLDSFVLYQGSSEIASIEKQDIPQTQISTIVFSGFDDIELGASATQSFSLKARVMPQQDNYPEGARVQASIGDALNNKLDFLYNDGQVGSASGFSKGMPRQLFVVYPKMVGAMSYSINVVQGTSNQAEAQFDFALEAVGGDVYVSDACEMIGGSQASFIFELIGEAGDVSLACALATNASEVQDGVYRIRKNRTNDFTINIRLVARDNPIGAFFATRFREIRWSITEQEMFSNMDSYEIMPSVITNSVFLITPQSSVAPPIDLDKVTGVVATTGSTDNVLNVVWDSVEDATSYDVWHCVGVCINDGDWTKQTSATNSKQLTSLNHNTTYKIRVRAKTSSAVGEWSDTATQTTSLTLIKVANVVVSTGTDDTKLSVAFDAQNKATNYEVEYRTSASAPSGSWTKVTSATSPKELTGLTYNTNYQVRVRAKNGSTTGDWSDIATGTTSLTLVKVSNVVVSTGADDTKLNISWTTQAKATSYEVEYRVTTNDPQAGWSSYATSSSPVVLQSLTHNTSYQVRVRAKTASIAGDWSDVASYTTSLTLIKVSNVVVSTGADDTKLSVSFTTQLKATSYDIWHCAGACAQDSDWTKTTSSSSPKVITGLSYNTEYKVQVRAKTSSTVGEWSDTATQTTSLTLIKVANVVVSTGTDDTKLSVAFDAQNKATNYEIEYRTSASAPSGSWTKVTSATSPKVIESLSYNTNYQVRVRAKNGSTTGDWSDIATQTTSLTLSKVSNVVASVGSDDTKLSVSWTTQNKATSYEVEYRTSASAPSGAWSSVTATVSPKEITGLSHNTEYQIRVRAKAGVATGNWSDIKTHTTSLTLTKVAGVSVSTGSTDEQLSVSWTTQSKATNYEIEYRTSASAPSGSWTKVTSATSPKEIEGLTYNTEYQVRVRAKNGSTTGDWSNVKTHTTSLTLTKVAGVSINTGNADEELSLSWTTQSKATNYDIWHCAGACAQDSDWTKTTSSTSPKVISGLTHNTEYKVKVRAKTVSLTGDWSDVKTRTTSLTLTKVAGVSVSTGSTDEQLSVSWTTQSKATNYDIWRCAGSCINDSDWTKLTSSTSPKVITGLSYNTEYKVKVRAKTASLTGDWSDTETYTTSLTLVKVSNVVASAGTDDTKLSVSFTTQLKATSYDVEYRTSASAPSGAWSNETTTTSPKEITGLSYNTNYQVRVRAKTSSVTGDWSDIATGTTSLTLVKVSNVVVSTGADDTKLSVAFDAQNKATNYDIWHCAGSCAQDSDWTKTTSTISPKVITGLTYNTEYKVKVRAKTASVTGDWSDTETYTTSLTLVKVSNVVASAGTDDTKLSVSFTTQLKATSYDVEYRTSASAPSGSWTNTTSATSPKVIESLTYNTEYQVRVRAKNGTTTGAWSDVKTRTTSTTLVKVTGVSVSTSDTDEKLSVAFDAQNKATNYEIEYRTSASAPSGSWTKVTSATRSESN